MDAAMSAQLVAGRGIVGNANQGGKRQVTLMSAERWSDLTADLGTPGRRCPQGEHPRLGH